MLSSVSPGASFVIETTFIEQDGTAFITNTPPTYVIRTPDDNLVLTGTPQQDPQVPARWYSTVTIPQNVPIYDQDKKYTLSWFAVNGKNKRTNVEFFNVAPLTDFKFVENDKVVVDGTVIKDKIYLPNHMKPDCIGVNIRQPNGVVLFSGRVNPLPVANYFDRACYSFSVPTSTVGAKYDNNGQPHIIEWQYDINRDTQYEYHFIYIISTKLLIYMNDLRRMIDKARNEDIIPQLQFTDVDLIHCLFKAMERINTSKPIMTNYSLYTLPMALNVLLVKIAGWEALNAQLLAEGVSNFDFSGQSVSLNVDRTAAYEAMLGRLDAQIGDNLEKTKRILTRSANIGVLGLSLGVSNNMVLSGAQQIDQLRQIYNSSGVVMGNSMNYLSS